MTLDELEKRGPRDLFPNLDRYVKYLDRREYVEDTLLQLIEEDDFILTEALANYGVFDLIGDVLLGHTKDEANKPQTTHVDPAFADKKVKLKAINGHDSIKWKHGRKKDRAIGLLNRALSNKSKSVKLTVPDMREIDKNEALFSLPEAYKILKQCGRFVKFATSGTMNKRWRVEEVPNAPKAQRKQGSKPAHSSS